MAARRRRKLVIQDLERFTERSIRRLHLRVFQTLTLATPVKTGFARAGWSPATGSPKPGPATPESREAAAAQASSLFGANQQVAAAIANGYRLSEGPIFIVNNVRYVTFLDQGTSAQAPAGFIQAAVMTAVRATQREIRQ